MAVVAFANPHFDMWGFHEFRVNFEDQIRNLLEIRVNFEDQIRNSFEIRVNFENQIRNLLEIRMNFENRKHEFHSKFRVKFVFFLKFTRNFD